MKCIYIYIYRSRHLQATDTVCRCRYILQHTINVWNEQCQYFSQQIRTIKKSNSSGILTVNFGFTSAVGENVVRLFVLTLFVGLNVINHSLTFCR